MSDFSGAALAWAFIIIVVFMSVVFGREMNETKVKSQCEDFERISIDKNVYQCKLIKESP